MNSQTNAKAMPAATELATFGGGCFWCIEAVFERLDGVQSVVSGYAGGKSPNPTYRQVCGGTTGHAEAVAIGVGPGENFFGGVFEGFLEGDGPTTPKPPSAHG